MINFFKKKQTNESNSVSQSFSKIPLKSALLNRITDNTASSEIGRSRIDDVVPAASRMKNAIPSKHGLYPHEVLVLDYAGSFYTEDNNFQGFWWYSYGVKNVAECLSSLLQRGFLQIGDVQRAIARENATVLKEELKKRGLKISGRKADLVNRLMEEVSYEELNLQFSKRTYQLTELGEEALAEESYVPYIHRHQFENLDIWLLNKIVHTQPKTSYQDKVWEYLNKRSIEHLDANNFGMYRNCRHYMHQFLMEEKRCKEALAMLAEVVYYDLSGLGNGYDPQYFHEFAKYFFPYSKSIAKTAPGIINAILNCQDKTGLSEEELREIFLARMSMLRTPVHLFYIEECVDIIFMEIRHDEEELNKVYAKAEQRYNLKN
jgi:hypothetical protein